MKRVQRTKSLSSTQDQLVGDSIPCCILPHFTSHEIKCYYIQRIIYYNVLTQTRGLLYELLLLFLVLGFINYYLLGGITRRPSPVCVYVFVYLHVLSTEQSINNLKKSYRKNRVYRDLPGSSMDLSAPVTHDRYSTRVFRQRVPFVRIKTTRRAISCNARTVKTENREHVGGSRFNPFTPDVTVRKHVLKTSYKTE